MPQIGMGKIGDRGEIHQHRQVERVANFNRDIERRIIQGSLRPLHAANLHYREVSGPEALSRMWLIHNHAAPSATALAFLDVILPRVGDLPDTQALDAMSSVPLIPRP